MKLNIFGKQRTTRDGKTFTSFLTTMRKVTGEEVTCQVKFKKECDTPEKLGLPRVIEVVKEDCNFVQKVVETKDGNEAFSKTLWISKWKDAGEYVDHSMDDFED